MALFAPDSSLAATRACNALLPGSPAMLPAGGSALAACLSALQKAGFDPDLCRPVDRGERPDMANHARCSCVDVCAGFSMRITQIRQDAIGAPEQNE
jgi:hypothetical protein